MNTHHLTRKFRQLVFLLSVASVGIGQDAQKASQKEVDQKEVGPKEANPARVRILEAIRRLRRETPIPRSTGGSTATAQFNATALLDSKLQALARDNGDQPWAQAYVLLERCRLWAPVSQTKSDTIAAYLVASPLLAELSAVQLNEVYLRQLVIFIRKSDIAGVKATLDKLNARTLLLKERLNAAKLLTQAPNADIRDLAPGFLKGMSDLTTAEGRRVALTLVEGSITGKQFAEAETVLQQVLENTPFDQRESIYARLGMLQLAQGNIAGLERVVKQAEEFYKGQELTPKFDAARKLVSYYQHLVTLLRGAKSPLWLNYARKAIDLNPKTAEEIISRLGDDYVPAMKDERNWDEVMRVSAMLASNTKRKAGVRMADAMLAWSVAFDTRRDTTQPSAAAITLYREHADEMGNKVLLDIGLMARRQRMAELAKWCFTTLVNSPIQDHYAQSAQNLLAGLQLSKDPEAAKRDFQAAAASAREKGMADQAYVALLGEYEATKDVAARQLLLEKMKIAAQALSDKDFAAVINLLRREAFGDPVPPAWAVYTMLVGLQEERADKQTASRKLKPAQLATYEIEMTGRLIEAKLYPRAMARLKQRETLFSMPGVPALDIDRLWARKAIVLWNSDGGHKEALDIWERLLDNKDRSPEKVGYVIYAVSQVGLLPIEYPRIARWLSKLEQWATGESLCAVLLHEAALALAQGDKGRARDRLAAANQHITSLKDAKLQVSLTKQSEILRDITDGKQPRVQDLSFSMRIFVKPGAPTAQK